MDIIDFFSKQDHKRSFSVKVKYGDPKAPRGFDRESYLALNHNTRPAPGRKTKE